MHKIKPEEEMEKRITDVSRRTYLGAVAGSVFANAATVTAKDVDTSKANWLGTDDKYIHEGVGFKVADIFVQDSLAFYSTPDSVHVRNSDGIQYVFVNLQFDSADTVRPPISSFAFIADEKQYEAGDIVDGVPLFAITDKYRDKMGQTYHTEPMTPPESAVRVPPRYKNPVFTLGFAVPTNLQAERFGVGLVSTQQVEVAWKLDNEKAKKLQTSPQYEVVSVETPNQITRDEPFEIEVSVKNTGEREGTYQAVIGLKESHHKKELVIPVSAGEQASQTKRFRYPPATRPELNEEVAEYQLIRDNEMLAKSKLPVEVE